MHKPQLMLFTRVQHTVCNATTINITPSNAHTQPLDPAGLRTQYSLCKMIKCLIQKQNIMK